MEGRCWHKQKYGRKKIETEKIRIMIIKPARFWEEYIHHKIAKRAQHVCECVPGNDRSSIALHECFVCTCMHYWCKEEIVLQHLQMLYRQKHVWLHITRSSGWKLQFNTTVIMSRSLTTHLSRPSKGPCQLVCLPASSSTWFPRANTELSWAIV